MNERKTIVELVRKFGGSTTDAVLDPECNFFTLPGIEGLISYRKILRCVVAFGDPVCEPHNRERLVLAFREFCRNQNLKIVYLVVSKEFADWERENFGGAYLEYGEELFLDPHLDPREKTGTHACLVRRKVKQAIREGITIHEYHGQNIEIEQEIENVGNEWLQNRKGPQIHISRVYLFEDRLGKRWFYAKKGETIIGVIVLNELKSKNGWHLNHLMFKPKSPNGAPELLVTSVLEVLKNESCHYVTFGSVVSGRKELGEMIGFGKIFSWLARKGFFFVHRFFQLDGTKTFWDKFLPESKPSYLLFQKSRIGISEILGILRALNVRF